MQPSTIISTTRIVSNDFPQNNISSSGYPRPIRTLFFVFALYLVLPIIDLPILGLSLSAPLFFVVAVACLLKPPKPWFHSYQRWIFFAGMILVGIFIATTGNGLFSGGVSINSEGILTVIRYAYWLLVFVITTYFVSHEHLARQIAKLIGWGIFSLALLRYGEAIFYGNIGAWTSTRFLLQNDYGFLFSTFSPFLLVFLLQEKGPRLLLAITANIMVWGAVAINGSRGAWISMATGLVIALILLLRAWPRKFMGLLVGVLFAGGILAMFLVGVPKFSSAVTERLNTFQSLETDKSYAIRRLMNQKAIYLFKDSPLIGVGTARFRLSSVPLEIPSILSYASQEHFDRKSAHNSYLSFLAENGLIAALPFGLLLTMLTVKTFKVQSHFIRQNTYWVLAIFLSFTQMSIHMWVISSLTNTANWFIYGLVAAVIMYGNTYKAQ